MTAQLSLARRAALCAAGAVCLVTGSVSAVPAMASTSPCSNLPDVSDSAAAERCVTLGASLSAAPAVGGSAVLTVTLTARTALTGLHVGATLPRSLRWVGSPVEATARLAAGQTARYQATVRAVSAGAGIITVAASGAEADATAAVPLTIGSTAAQSHLGITTADHLTAVRRAAGAPAPVRAQAGKPTALQRSTAAAARRPVLGGNAGTLAAGGTACLTGSWNYIDGYEEEYAAISWRVEAWDRDTNSADDLLATGMTGGDGGFDLCFDNTDSGTAGNDVYVKLIPDTGDWRVEDNTGTTYEFRSAVDGDVLDDTTADFGALWIDAPFGIVGQIYRATQDTWNALPGACWDLRSTCRPVVVRWGPDSATSGTSHYSLGSNVVILTLAGAGFYTTIVHEVGHSIMDDVFDDHFPSAPNCNPHSFHTTSSAGCAWTEGFANWMPTVVYGSQGRVEDSSASTPNMADGDTCECRVAGALNDLVDFQDDGLDTYGEGLLPIWDTIQDHNSRTFAEFWADRGTDGFDVGQDPLAALFQNTIDYGFAG